MKRNVIVAQSGGPSPVINASLLGVIHGCQNFPDHVGNIFAALHGVEGILKEDTLNKSWRVLADCINYEYNNFLTIRTGRRTLCRQ